MTELFPVIVNNELKSVFCFFTKQLEQSPHQHLSAEINYVEAWVISTLLFSWFKGHDILRLLILTRYIVCCFVIIIVQLFYHLFHNVVAAAGSVINHYRHRYS